MTHRHEGTVTLPLGLARELMRAAYWPAVTADLLEVMGPKPGLPALTEERQDALDAWLSAIGGSLGGDRTSERMLAAVQAAWARGSRP